MFLVGGFRMVWRLVTEIFVFLSIKNVASSRLSFTLFIVVNFYHATLCSEPEIWSAMTQAAMQSLDHHLWRLRIVTWTKLHLYSPGDFVLDGDPVTLPEKGAGPPIFGPCVLRPDGCMDQDATCYRGRHCVRWDPAPPPQQGGGALPPFCGPCLLWPNGWMDQDGTGHGGGSWSRPHCARWGPSSLLPKRGQCPPIFGQCLLWPNGWMHQDGTWYGSRPQPRRLCVRWPVSPKRGGAPNFWPMSIVAKLLDGLRCHLVWR